MVKIERTTPALELTQSLVSPGARRDRGVSFETFAGSSRSKRADNALNRKSVNGKSSTLKKSRIRRGR